MPYYLPNKENLFNKSSMVLLAQVNRIPSMRKRKMKMLSVQHSIQIQTIQHLWVLINRQQKKLSCVTFQVIK